MIRVLFFIQILIARRGGTKKKQKASMFSLEEFKKTGKDNWISRGSF